MIKCVSCPDNVTIYFDENGKKIIAFQDIPIYDKKNPKELIGYTTVAVDK